MIIPLNPQFFIEEPAGFARGGAEHHQWCRWSMLGPWCGSAPLWESGGSSFSLGGRGCFGLFVFFGGRISGGFPMISYMILYFLLDIFISIDFVRILRYFFVIVWGFLGLLDACWEFLRVLRGSLDFRCISLFCLGISLGFYSGISFGCFGSSLASLGSSLFFLWSGSFKMFWVL